MMKWVYDDSNDSFAIKIGEFTAPRGIDLDDITEAVYMVKNNKTDDDVAALVTLTLGSGITKLAGATETDAKLKVKFSASDFGTGKLELGTRYYAGVGIKTATMTKFLEIILKDDRLMLSQDIIHD